MFASPGAVRLRLPANAPLHRTVTVNGKQVPLRELDKHVDPNERIRLKNGKEVSLQGVIDAFEALEKKSNTKLSTLPARASTSAETKAKIDETHRQIAEEQKRLRDHESKGWKDFLAHPVGSPRAFHPLVIAHPDAPTTSVPKGAPMPKAEPVELVWQKHWGISEASVELDVKAGNDFAYDKGDSNRPVAGCAGIIEANVQLMGHAHKLARGVIVAAVHGDKLLGQVRIYFRGQAAPVWEESKEESFKFLKVERDLKSQPLTTSIPIYPPLNIDAEMWAGGGAKIESTLRPSIVKGKTVSCTATITPELSAKAFANATLKLSGLAQEIEEVLVGSITAGVDFGSNGFTLFKLSLPSKVSLDLVLDPATKLPKSMDQDLQVSLDATLLSGEAFAFIDLEGLGWWKEHILAMFFSDGVANGRHEKEIHKWAGTTLTSNIIGPVKHTIAFGQ